MIAKVIQIGGFSRDPFGYKAMSTMQLMEEMVEFHLDRKKMHFLTPTMIARGKALFTSLELKAETQELRTMCRGYLNQLNVQYFISKNNLTN